MHIFVSKWYACRNMDIEGDKSLFSSFSPPPAWFLLTVVFPLSVELKNDFTNSSEAYQKGYTVRITSYFFKCISSLKRFCHFSSPSCFTLIHLHTFTSHKCHRFSHRFPLIPPGVKHLVCKVKTELFPLFCHFFRILQSQLCGCIGRRRASEVLVKSQRQKHPLLFSSLSA